MHIILSLRTGSIGSGSPRVMLGPAHVDVVPVTPDNASETPEVYSGWDENPWSGTVAGGEIFGRGAVSQLLTPDFILRWKRPRAGGGGMYGLFVVCLKEVCQVPFFYCHAMIFGGLFMFPFEDFDGLFLSLAVVAALASTLPQTTELWFLSGMRSA